MYRRGALLAEGPRNPVTRQLEDDDFRRELRFPTRTVSTFCAGNLKFARRPLPGVSALRPWIPGEMSLPGDTVFLCYGRPVKRTSRVSLTRGRHNFLSFVSATYESKTPVFSS